MKYQSDLNLLFPKGRQDYEGNAGGINVMSFGKSHIEIYYRKGFLKSTQTQILKVLKLSYPMTEHQSPY